MRNALPPNRSGLPRYGFTCQACRQVITTEITGLFTNPNRGNTQRFCSPACRQAAHRRRRAGVAEDQPRQHTGGRTRKLNKDQQDQ
jgi:hypothetical protein